MKMIGIIGAENSHAAAIAKIINVERKVPGFRVVAIWGEKPEFAEKTAAAGAIPVIVRRSTDMLGMIDALIIDHRHGKFHLPAALPFLEARIPLFIDKPFCCDLAEGRRFLDRAAKLKVPVTSFSVLPKQKAFGALKRDLAKLGALQAVVTTGPCDIKSIYGGIFFYGIHQVGLVLEALGYDVVSVRLNAGKTNSTATLFYGDGRVVTMNLIGAGHPPFHLSAVGEKGRLDRQMVYDKNIYLAGVKEFTTMFRTGKTRETRQSMLAPVAVLQALQNSQARGGRTMKVAAV